MDLGRVDIAMMSVYLIQGYNLTLNLFNFYLVHFNKILDLFSMTSRLPLWLTQGKESPCNAGDLGSIPGLGRSSREGNSYPFQYSCLENSMDRGAWQATWGRKESDTTARISLSQYDLNT